MTATRLQIVVTGAGGQLGRELTHWSTDAADIVGLGRDQLDITSLDQCRDVLNRLQPDIVIHCAAYTAVDQAESDPDEAFRVNAVGTHNVAVAANEAGAKLCYISTDYVFDGKGQTPYSEYEQTNPLTIYGKSKLAGEMAVQTLHGRYFIVRTSWVFGKFGNNFVNTMLKLSKERDHIKVVADQIGSPTYTHDLAAFLLELVQTEHYGIYHASNTGTCSWYEFAKAIFEESGSMTRVDPCSTEQFPRPAQRPSFSAMEHAAIRRNGLQQLRSWREALRHYMRDSE